MSFNAICFVLVFLLGLLVSYNTVVMACESSWDHPVDKITDIVLAVVCVGFTVLMLISVAAKAIP